MGPWVAVTDGSGNAIAVNRYDEYGIPQSTNLGRFQYTGQTWLPELGMYYYKARIYSPTLGRFLQTDPIRYGGGMNMYAYVGGDPVNRTDPSGLLDIQICRSVPVSVTIEQDGASPPSSGRRPSMKQICDYYHIPDEHFGQPYLPYFPIPGAIPDSFPTPHEYIVNNKVAPAGQCSAGEFADGFRRHIVPGVPSSQPIQSGQSYTARDPGLSISPYGWGPSGPVISTQIGETHFRNQTEARHPLHNGSIDRIAYQSGGDWYVATIGVGVNTSPVMALANEIRGPAIFNGLDRDLATYLKVMCDGK